MPDARCTRGPMCDCAKESLHMSIQVQRRTSDIPCAMALRLMTWSPRWDGLYCHRRPLEALAPAGLDAVTGARTTRFYRTPLPRPSIATSASTATRPSSWRRPTPLWVGRD